MSGLRKMLTNNDLQTDQDQSFKLPPLLELTGNWESDVETLYKVFRTVFIDKRLFIDNKILKLRKHPIYDKKEATFWHIISEGEKEDQRLPSLERCHRIHWIKEIIENKDHSSIRCWEEVRKCKRVCLALKDFSYIVVLEERADYWLLITAFPINRKHQREKKRKKWENFMSLKKTKQGVPFDSIPRNSFYTWQMSYIDYR